MMFFLLRHDTRRIRTLPCEDWFNNEKPTMSFSYFTGRIANYIIIRKKVMLICIKSFRWYFVCFSAFEREGLNLSIRLGGIAHTRVVGHSARGRGRRAFWHVRRLDYVILWVLTGEFIANDRLTICWFTWALRSQRHGGLDTLISHSFAVGR